MKKYGLGKKHFVQPLFLESDKKYNPIEISNDTEVLTVRPPSGFS